MSRPRLTRAPLALAAAAAALALAPSAAHAGTAISSLPNLPTGARIGTILNVLETGLPGQVSVTQTFNGADAAAIARLRQIRLAPSCGPGPSTGNPSGNGPAINDPEVPCTNPDLGVFGAIGPVGMGGRECAGIAFAIGAPDAQGQIEIVPALPVYLTSGQTCEISFTFSVLRVPTKDTFPTAAGVQTTSVSSVRSEVVADPGNPGAIGLQAAGLGSGDVVEIAEPPPPSDPPADPPTDPPCTPVDTSGSCAGTRGRSSSSPRLSVAGSCVKGRVRASVIGDGIKKVTYRLGGRVVGVAKGSAPYKLNVSARSLRAGSSRLTATVQFTAGGAPDQLLSRRIARCRAPRFTG